MAHAQPKAAGRRIGILSIGTAITPDEARQEGQPLRELGWVEGQNLQVERVYANGRAEALQGLAEDLVRAKVEVILTFGTAASLAAKRATSSVPIVFSAGDPVLLGLVSSLARPGGNATGYSQAKPEIAAYYLSILKELIPGLRRIAVLEYAANPYYRAARSSYEETCRSLGLEAIFVQFAAENEIERIITELREPRVQALVVRGDAFVYDYRKEISTASLRQRLPTMAEQSQLVREAAVLASYSPARDEEDRRVASYVDRILRGAKPAELPVEMPSRFELLFNLRIAQALGLTIPRSLLLRASEVIQ
jgi:putative ABC transport system substrate-binding protein